jgi:hypothetical protein
MKSRTLAQLIDDLQRLVENGAPLDALVMLRNTAPYVSARTVAENASSGFLRSAYVVLEDDGSSE